MNVASYTFQSPSTSQVQVGKLDPSSVKQDDVKKENNDVSEKDETNKPTQTLQQTDSNRLLDIYA